MLDWVLVCLMVGTKTWEDVLNHEGMTYRILNHKLKLHSIKHIKRYIKSKKEWISSLN